ncbi:MAG TPA: 1,6-anhydro-N-acetylmuramyl-L-alanine amidase AmpD [Mariprofundaceae bacterium]|nr:1,6-anhydro-N-acetylmuramyl-L-alanine amidase AmpD [Mariprofundaceae bacterium]
MSRFVTSPHYNARPADTAIDLIVLHAISLPPGEFDPATVEAFFTGRLDTTAHPAFASLAGVRVSAHFVVDRDGGITQFVPVAQRAWHAGESAWQGRSNCNDYSIGIEMIGDEAHPFTDAQYRETARLCKALMQRFPAIDVARIVGHRDVAPTRKWDPGRQWDWPRFRQSLADIDGPEPEIL